MLAFEGFDDDEKEPKLVCYKKIGLERTISQ
jgi:hypothetical protein